MSSTMSDSSDIQVVRAEVEEMVGLELPPRWVECIHQFHELLVDANARRNLTRLTSREDFLYKHVLDSLLLVGAFPAIGEQPLRVIDVGCGGGIPGLVLALSCPLLSVTEIDSSQRKIEWVEKFIAALGLERSRAVASQARELAHREEFRGSFDVVVARAVGAAADLISDCRRLLAPRGTLALYKTPAQVEQETPAAEREARKRGLAIRTSDCFELPGGRGDRQFLFVSQS